MGVRRFSVALSMVASQDLTTTTDEATKEPAAETTAEVSDENNVNPDDATLTWWWIRYIFTRLRTQTFSVAMISGYLLICYIIMLRKAPPGYVFFGLVAVVFGITLFMEGFMSGIMPLAEVLGEGIVTKFTFNLAMLTTWLLGIGCTLAEPAMGALELAGSMVCAERAPLLWYLLNPWNFYVFMAVGIGVGFAALVGTARLLSGWDLKFIIYATTVKTITCTVLTEYVFEVPEIVGLAWDAGAVTTGAVTVPIILGLGVGIMTTDRKKRGVTDEANPLDSFGIVTLASLYPVIGVTLLGLICRAVTTDEEIIAEFRAKHGANCTNVGSGPSDGDSIVDQSPLAEFLYATRSVVPLLALVIGLITLYIGKPLPYIKLNVRDVEYNAIGGDDEPMSIGQETDEEATTEEVQDPTKHYVSLHALVGVVEAYLGLMIFNIGLKYGQGPLGDLVGASVPGLYSKIDTVEDSPIFDSRGLGLALVMLFTFFMALIATYAEPALNAMGITTEQLTNGAFERTLLLLAVAVGVGVGVMLGVARMVWGWNLTNMLCIGYALALTLTYPSRLEYVAVAWDCAGVTTSSITVPLVLAMGIGLGNELKVQDAFGLLAMGSVGPICSVLIAGLLVRAFATDSDDNPESSDAPASGTEGPTADEDNLPVPTSPASSIAKARKDMSMHLTAAADREEPLSPTNTGNGRWGRAGGGTSASKEKEAEKQNAVDISDVDDKETLPL